MLSENKMPNRLVNEKSPYLLQHAYNPVNWFPWGEEAFAKAREEDKPIFLSVGYSTCHWCHVMERESFEDEEVAEILNESFVSIKVDREERPDIDHIYMQVCQTLTGSGGWPLTIIMTPDKNPFFSGTYFPKNNRMNMQGLLSILGQVKELWQNNREKIILSSEQILNLIRRPEDNLNEDFNLDIIKEAFLQFKSDFDNQYGGFGSAPKFPAPHNLYFLLRYWYVTKDKYALQMVEKTLDSMYEGGIFDHIGFGFSRYSTDRKWLVPHFEKMLYDNALLAIAYLETYQITGNSKYSDIANKIFTYIIRDMTSKEGAFFSAEDADSEGEEGKFYVWTTDEIKRILGDSEGSKFCEFFDITPQGNFEDKNIPNLIKSADKKMDTAFVNQCREKLFNYREKRVHPYKDDKILTSWNGLMIAALAIGARILDNQKYLHAAENAAEFILKKLINNDGRLLARYRDGQAAFHAYVDDYAFLIWGLIELYESSFKAEYLMKAATLNKDLLKYFWDNNNGGFFVYGSDSEQLITRPKEIYDGATPSGNAAAALNLIRLARLTGENDLEDKSYELLKSFARMINQYPRAYSFSLITLLYIQSKGKEIVITTDNIDNESKKIIDIINKKYMPFTSTVLYDNKNLQTSDYKIINGKPTVYVCENFSCKAPMTDIDEIEKAVNSEE